MEPKPSSPPQQQPPASPPPPAPEIPVIERPSMSSSSNLPFIPFRDPRFARFLPTAAPFVPATPTTDLIPTSAPPSPSTETLREFMRVNDQLGELDSRLKDLLGDSDDDDDDDDPMEVNGPILSDEEILRTQRRQLRERLDNLIQQIQDTDIFTVTRFSEFQVITEVKQNMSYQKIFVDSSTPSDDVALIEHHSKVANSDERALATQTPRLMLLKESTLTPAERASLPSAKPHIFAQVFPGLPPPPSPPHH